jgi:hypothetical protein
MSKIESTEEKTHVGTLTKEKAAVLMQARQNAANAARAAQEAEGIFRAMLALAMPAGANEFDPDTMSFFYNPARNPMGEASEPAGDTDGS